MFLHAAGTADSVIYDGHEVGDAALQKPAAHLTPLATTICYPCGNAMLGNYHYHMLFQGQLHCCKKNSSSWNTVSVHPLRSSQTSRHTLHNKHQCCWEV